MVLHPIVRPLSEFAHAKKGDALYGECSVFITQDVVKHTLIPHLSMLTLIFLFSFDSAMELALSLEKFVNEKLLNLQCHASLLLILDRNCSSLEVMDCFT